MGIAMSVLRYGLLAGLSVLVACGGGGGDTDPVPIPPQPPKPVNAAGLWVGSSSVGADTQFVVDEDLILWGVYQDPLTLASGALYSELKVDDADASGSTFVFDFRDYMGGGQVAIGEGTIKVAPEKSFDGNITRPTPVRFNTVFDPRFYQNATFTAIAGDWQLTLRDPASGARQPYGAMNISRLGAVNGTGLAGGSQCGFTGNMVPVAERGGYYTLMIQFSGSRECLMPGQTVTGVAVLNGAAEDAVLSLAMATADRWQGASAIALPVPAPTPPTPPVPE